MRFDHGFEAQYSCSFGIIALSAESLENLVLQNARRVLEDPGEVLRRVREQPGGDDQEPELKEHRESLEKSLANKPRGTEP
jgi:hypothetical protein